MLLSSRSLALMLTGFSGFVLAPPAQAQVTITCDQSVATSRVPCTLTASHSDGKPRTWRWGVIGLDDPGQLLSPIGPDQVRVKTPPTLVERTFTVVAEDREDPSVAGVFVLRVTPNLQPGSSERALAQELFPNAFTPSLVPFRGDPGRIVTGADLVRHQPVNGIAFCDDAAMGALDRCWILAKDSGLEAFKVAGDPVAIPGFPAPAPGGATCLAVATLPPGRGDVPAGAPRVVFCQEWMHGAREGISVCALEADGRTRVLAGGPEGFAVEGGPAGASFFKLVTDLALDRMGNVYVCQLDPGAIWKIGLDGRIRRFDLGDQGFGLPTCLAVDPATGDVYVGGRGYLAKLTPEGKLTPVIGGQNRALRSDQGVLLARLGPGCVPLDTQFQMNPRHLAMHDRELFMVDTDGIDAFHLDTRRLARIVPCDPRLKANRMGPVHYLNPHLPAGRCAVAQQCGPLALTKEAMCMVEVGQGLAELELPDDPVTSVMDPPRVERKEHFIAPIAAGDPETKESQRAAPEVANIWPGQALETLTVQPDIPCVVHYWRSAAPNQRFSGHCWVEARDLASGRAQVSLLFTDPFGHLMGRSEPAAPQMPDGVSAPAHGRTLLRLTGTAPRLTDRVGLLIQVVKGNPGATVTFHDVTCNQVNQVR